jgi:hypothetical protein
MILSAIVILLVAAIAYIWASRGFFSSLVHMLCVLIAGAVALGVWEPLAYLLLEKAGNKDWVLDMAWGVALVVPFAAVLALLRLLTNKVLPANAALDNVTNLIGGGACGVVSGTVSVGILVIAVSFLRVGQEFGGLTPVDFDNSGSVKRNERLIFPADRITAGLYAYLSDGALRTPTPLSVWRPALADDGSLLRASFNAGGSKITFAPSAYELLGRYTVGEQPPAGAKFSELLTDTLTPEGQRKQTVLDLDGNAVDATGARIEGFVVNFKPGAKEKTGGIIIGNPQVQLVCRNEDEGRSIALHPFAMISQQEAASKDLGRWRFDGPRNYFRSAGGASEAVMAFEFLVPRGYAPLALSVKGVRSDVSELAPFSRYAWIQQRDAAIRSGGIFSGVITGSGELDDSTAVTVSVDPTSESPEVIVSPYFMGAGILNKDNLKGLEINEDRHIISGEARFFRNELNNRGLERQLQVRQFAVTEDTRIVQVRVGVRSRIGLLSPPALATDSGQPPVLVDDAGQRYAAVGFVYSDTSEFHVRFEPGKPVRSTNELPSLSNSRPDQDLMLLYRVSEGVKIRKFAIGNKTVAIFRPEIEVPRSGF